MRNEESPASVPFWFSGAVCLCVCGSSAVAESILKVVDDVCRENVNLCNASNMWLPWGVEVH